MKYALSFTFLTISVIGTACNGQANKDSPKEKTTDSIEQLDQHPKLIKTIGNPKYGNVQTAIQDKAGNFWFGTTQNGVYKFDGRSFKQFTVADGLTGNNIFSTFEDKDGKIWIGTQTGLSIYDGKAFDSIKIPIRKNQPPNKNAQYRNMQWIFSIMQAKNGKLWFATIDGVYVYDGKTFTPFLVDDGGGGFVSSNNNVEYILEDKAGNMWFGGRSNEGVFRYDGKSVINLKIKQPGSFPDSLRGRNWAWPQLQDKDGNIWFSNWDGAYRYDGKSFTTFTKSDGLAGTVMITRIIEDKNGNLWFGGSGLSRYDGKSFTVFSKKDGLIHDGVWAILEDRTGKLWVGTRENDLYLFNGKKFIRYSE